MPSPLPSLYQLKKFLLWPRTMFMRWKYRDTEGPMRAMLELHYYRKPMIDWVGATIYNKHMLHEADIDEDSVVVDVGAFTGSWAQHIVDRYNPTIYAFEPNPQSYGQLMAKAADNPKLKPLPYGLGDEDIKVEFTLKGLGSSMYEERADHADVPRTEVEIAAIDRVWRELELGQVDLFKVNIEGAEFPLFEKMIAADLVKSVNTYLIQFHEWHPGAYSKRRRIREVLSQTHTCEWNYYFVWEKWVPRTTGA
ncbi:MAG: FkbM family methyltransferase [Halioglobus sp.]|nr:FkbM family methyltransferase [Halioglobus sp.]